MVNNYSHESFSFVKSPFFKKPAYENGQAASKRWQARTNPLRACTVKLSDSEPEKFGSLPESSWTNLRTILSFLQSYTIHFFHPIFDHNCLYLYFKPSFNKNIYHFFHYIIL